MLNLKTIEGVFFKTIPQPQHRLRWKKAITLIAIWGGMNLASLQANAGSGQFLETIGVSTAMGTLLGASTLPFYSSPGDHTGNIGVGLALGAVVGVGIWICTLVWGKEDQNPYAIYPYEESPHTFSSTKRFQATSGLTVTMPLVSFHI